MASQPTNSGLENFIKFGDRETPEYMKEVAESDLGETEELKEKCLREMKDLIKDSALNCITTDEFLLRFLRTKKFKVPDSFGRLKNYARERVESHKTLLELRPEVLEKCLRLNIMGYLPYRDAKESLIFFFSTGGWNPKVCSEKEMLAIIIVLANYASEQEYAQLTGGVLIFDTTSLPLAFLPYLMNNVYFGSKFLFNSLPMRFKVFHVINENFMLKYVLRLLDPFLPKKMKSRRHGFCECPLRSETFCLLPYLTVKWVIGSSDAQVVATVRIILESVFSIVLHGNTRDKFFQQLPPSIIPEEYGGKLGPLSNDHLIDIMLDYLQKMKDEQQYFLEQNPDERK